MSTKEEGITFSPREMEVLALAWQCFDAEPKVRLVAPLTLYDTTTLPRIFVPQGRPSASTMFTILGESTLLRCRLLIIRRRSTTRS
jgi:hypothetical protein